MVHVVGSDETHLLSPTTTAVWRRCDGSTTSTDLESLFPDEEPELRPELVQLALDQLERAGLVEDGGRSSDIQRESRRRFLKRAAIAAVAVPTITTIVTATPAAASSHEDPTTCSDDAGCDEPEVCIGGTCQPVQGAGSPCTSPTHCTSGICEAGTCRNNIGGSCPSNNVAGDSHCVSTTYCNGATCQQKKISDTSSSTSGCGRSGECQSGCCKSENPQLNKCQNSTTCHPQ